MKKGIIIILLAALLVASVSACGQSKPADKPAGSSNTSTRVAEFDSMVTKAIKELKKTWEAQIKESADLIGTDKPKVKIVNTRVIRIKENPVNVQNNETIEQLKDVEAIVEFELISNYFSDTYTTNAGVYDSVVVHRNGSVEVPSSNPMDAIRAMYFLSDFSGAIEEIVDLEDAYSDELF